MLGALSRARLPVVLAAVVGVLILAGGAWFLRSRSVAAAPVGGLGTRTVEAGAVTVEMTALSLDLSGARFKVVLDTHSGALDLDIAGASQLLVDGAVAKRGWWSGSVPGGHHREGELSYSIAVPPGADVQLRISGLAADVVGTWTAP